MVGVLLALLSLEITDLGIGFLYYAVTGETFYYRVVDPNRALNRTYRSRSAIYDHDLLPNKDVTSAWGPIQYRVVTNSLGFRDAMMREVSLHASGARVLFIGDSFTEGVGVSYEDTFVGRVGERLRARGVEVLNAGVSSYSPAIYFRKTRYLLEEAGLQFSHLVVFLDISDAEDEAENYKLDDRGNVASRKEVFPGIREFFQDYSILYAAPRLLKLHMNRPKRAGEADSNPLNASIDYRRALWTVDDRWFQRYGERGLQGMRENMDRLASLCKAHGVDLTVVVYPWPTQVFYADLDSKQVRFWRDWAGEQAVRFINLFPGFVSSDEAANRRTIQELFIADDLHWNAEGHKRVTELFLEQFPADLAQPPPPRADR